MIHEPPRFSNSAQTNRRAWVILVIVFLGLALLVIVICLSTPLWDWVSTRKRPLRGVSIEAGVTRSYLGWERARRWGGNAGRNHGKAAAYFLANGFKACESLYEDGAW